MRRLAIIWGAVASKASVRPGRAVASSDCRKAEEILRLSWREVDLNSAAIRLPAERAKNKEGRVIPLSSAALSVLEELPRFVGGILSSGRVVRHPSPASATPRRGSTTRLPKVKASRCQPGGCDIRRTVATGLQRLGTRLEVIEAVLGHVSGARAGIVGIYQRHRFEEEARAALTAWGQYVIQLVAPERTGSVLPFARLN